MIECKKCVNSTANPTITIDKAGLCNICSLYEAQFDPYNLADQRDFFMSLKNEKVMVGISGGKDSTATLYRVIEMGFKPTTFTFDLGYYPKHIFKRSKKVSDIFKVSHRKIDIRKYIRKSEINSYKLTERLYEKCEDPVDFIRLYQNNRKEYSVRSIAEMAFVRSCQICRKTVIRAYYQEALNQGAKAVILGMNEWTGLSNNQFHAIRKLKPYNCDPVYIIHLPFLLQNKITDTAEILTKLGWKAPEGEFLVESNANSCLFAKATEEKARKMLGFHPDSTRLSREVTVGFITKDQAEKALEKKNKSDKSVKEILEEAGIWTT